MLIFLLVDHRGTVYLLKVKEYVVMRRLLAPLVLCIVFDVVKEK